MKKLLKKLISIPSYDDGDIFESKIIDFLEEYVQNNFPKLKVERQELEKNRANLFISDGEPIKLLVVNHIDTVQPVAAWSTDPLEAYEKEGKLFGLGSSDTKGNIASFLTALSIVKNTKGLAILFYIDEEYDFLGMKGFINSDFAKSIDPEYVLSLDGSSLILGNGCRGLVEASIELTGRSGHSANPEGSISANMGFINTVTKLKYELNQFNSETLGKPTLNIARMRGGVLTSNSNVEFSDQGNITSDYLESIIEIRTIPGVDASWLKKKLYQYAKEEQLEVKLFTIRHDLGAYETKCSELNDILNIVQLCTGNKKLLDVSTFGYLDLAMLREVYSKAKLFSFGAGTIGQAHKADESVVIEDLELSSKIYAELIRELCGIINP